MTERGEQECEFLVDHEEEMMAIAKARNWGSKGFELKGWVIRLLPDGYRCPAEET